MQPLSPESLIHQLNWRYAVKKFDAQQKIPSEVWRALEDTLVLTPSSYGLQPWRFIVITDQATREKLVPFSWKQHQPAQCSHFVVFAARRRLTEADVDAYLARVAEVRGVAIESLAGFRKMMIGHLVAPPGTFNIHHWAALQAYIALGNFMTSAAMLGVDTCPMEGIEPAKYDEMLGLAGSEFATVVACAAGYRAADDKYAALAKVRFPHEQVIQRI